MAIYLFSATPAKASNGSTYQVLTTVSEEGLVSKHNYFKPLPPIKTYHEYRFEENRGFINIVLLGQAPLDYEPLDAQLRAIARLVLSEPDAPQVPPEGLLAFFRLTCPLPFNEQQQIFLEDLAEKWAEFPAAAKHHHTQKGGLITHVYEVLHIFEALFLTRLNPFTDQSESLFGITDEEYRLGLLAIFFHDAGKVNEYRPLPEGGFEFIPESVTYPHPYSSCDILREFHALNPRAFDFDTVATIIRQHHALPQWGSSSTPTSPVAQLVHFSDMFSKLSWDYRSMGKAEFPYQLSRILK